MSRRRLAALLVLGVARSAQAADASGPADAGDAGEVNAAPAQPPAPVAPPPPPTVSLAPARPPASVVVEPLVPPREAGGGGPLVAGALTAFVPFVVGCALWASNEIALQRAGTYVMATGFAAAPWVSHGLQRRWQRAAIFGSISAATSAATLIAMQAKDPFVSEYANRQRVAFGVFLTSAMFAAAVGVFDSFLGAPAREAP
jgi:hypothetical protein